MKTKKNLYYLFLSIILVLSCVNNQEKDKSNFAKKDLNHFKSFLKEEESSESERALFVEERLKHEWRMQVNPSTGHIPMDLKKRELQKSLAYMQASKNGYSFNGINDFNITYELRGPSNLGGRTRVVKYDLQDPSGNTILAGGVSSGLFRTTNGGASWTKVSPNDAIYNVTALAQDPRPGFQNIWYYGTGEGLGNSASLDGSSFYFGQGLWRSTDNGTTWSQFSNPANREGVFDSFFDITYSMQVNPINGDLYIAGPGGIIRWNGILFEPVLDLGGSGNVTTVNFSDIVITGAGRLYAALGQRYPATLQGVWTSTTGNIGSWTRIASPGNPVGYEPDGLGRTVLALAPSNQNLLYVLYDNGFETNTAAGEIGVEAGLWRYDNSSGTWIDFSDRLPDEPGNNRDGNDPFAVQSGYDLVISVRPNDPNYVLIGGTNLYKIEDIETDATFQRIGGYLNNAGYALYSTPAGDDHHPDLHAITFNPQNPMQLISGSDGGVHRTDNVDAAVVNWTNLNNFYLTYQYYHVAIDPFPGSDIVIGGAQDNGTTIGGIDLGQPNSTEMIQILGGDGVSVGISREDDCVPLFLGVQNGLIFRSCPADDSNITPDPEVPSDFVTYFYLDPYSNNALYYAGQDQLLKTNDSNNVTSTTWINAGTITTNGEPAEWITTFATSPGTYNSLTSYLLVGGDDGSVLRLYDPQNPVTGLDDALNIAPDDRNVGAYISGIATHPTNRETAILTYASYGTNNIWITDKVATGGGADWRLVNRNLSDFSIRSCAIAEGEGQTIYFVGTARGLYSNTDPDNQDWVLESPDLIGNALVSSLKYRPEDKKLLIGTHGNGMMLASISFTALDRETITDNTSIDNFLLYPNPVRDVINLGLTDTMNSQQDNLSYSIYDLSGKRVLDGALSSREVNVSNLPSGIYLLQVAGSRNLKVTRKFVKQ